MKSNWYMTVVAILTITKQYGSIKNFINQDDVLEDRIQKNREARMKITNDHM
jgi:hypothetical protein